MNKVNDQFALNIEIAEMLYFSNRRSLVAALLVMASLLYSQSSFVTPSALISWTITFLFAYGFRTGLCILFFRDPEKEQRNHIWLTRYRLTTGLCGIAWGSAGILLFPPLDTAHQAFLIFALVGVSGGGVIIYSIDTISSNLFSGGILLFMLPQILLHGSQLSVMLSMLFVVYVMYVTVAGRGLAKSLRENMSLRIASNLDNKKVHQLAYYDFLTNLPNRRLLTDRLNQAFARCARSHTYGAILSLDLNNFKRLNDSKGHLAGDELLKQVAARLQDTMRKRDTVARMGGDEFIAVLDDLGADKQQAVVAARVAAEKLLDIFAQPFQLGHYLYHTTPSIGITLFTGDEADVAEVLRRADVAMYQSKKSESLNSIQFYDESLQPSIELRATLENDLIFALKENQLSLHYQLQVDHQQDPIGAEVLLRWEHPELGMVPPDQFIPIAEESGAIVPIGAWVLTQACKQLKEWELANLSKKLKLSVNVSAVQFSQPDFVQNVTAIVIDSGCNPRLLCLELTESLIIKNLEDVIDKIKALKKLGIRFSLDDFGIGQSSLSVLKRLPLDELKIDRSFIKDILHNDHDNFIVKTIISMGNNLGHNVIAEGVEVQQQKELLDSMGCNAYQGYLFSRPLPLTNFEEKLLHI